MVNAIQEVFEINSVTQPSEALIERAQKDVRAAYQLWVDFVKRQAESLINRYSPLSDVEREEILAEVRHRFVDNLPSLKEPQKLIAWTDLIVRNACNSRYRTLLAEYHRTMPEISSAESDPEDGLIEEETQIKSKILSIILEKMEELPLKEREAIIEVILKQSTYDEVAQKEGVTPNTIRYRVQAGIRELNREFKRLADADPRFDAEIEAIFGQWRERKGLPEQVCEKLKRRREEILNLTLEQMAEKCGLSASTLSLVERGIRMPSLKVLQKIAAAYEITNWTTMMLSSRVTEKSAVAIKRNTPLITTELEDQLIYEVHRSERVMNAKMLPCFVVIPPKSNSGNPTVHFGEELVFVIEGAVDYYVDKEKYHLEDGDLIHLQADKPHWIENPEDKEARLLAVKWPAE